jgi:hypothetical protein
MDIKPTWLESNSNLFSNYQQTKQMLTILYKQDGIWVLAMQTIRQLIVVSIHFTATFMVNKIIIHIEVSFD